MYLMLHSSHTRTSRLRTAVLIACTPNNLIIPRVETNTTSPRQPYAATTRPPYALPPPPPPSHEPAISPRDTSTQIMFLAARGRSDCLYGPHHDPTPCPIRRADLWPSCATAAPPCMPSQAMPLPHDPPIYVFLSKTFSDAPGHARPIRWHDIIVMCA